MSPSNTQDFLFDQLFQDAPRPRTANILYVDDDDTCRHAMRRSMRPFRSQLHMELAGDGCEALQRMRTHPIDVVITDLKMPGMDGGSLLDTIRREWPDTIRVVLSGEADQLKILSGFGPAHRFFGKPTPPTSLFSAVLDSLQLRKTVSNPRIKRIMLGIDTLPYPRSYFLELIEELRSDDASNASVSRQIARNTAMAATVIRMANSPIYAADGKVETVERAVQLLGFDHLQLLALSTGMYESGKGSDIPQRELSRIGMEAISIGQLAAQIIELETGDRTDRDLALTAGMLSPIGKLLLLQFDPAALESIRRMSRATGKNEAAVERELFDATHPELGAHLMSLWAFPDPLTKCVLSHREPVVDERMSPAARAVHAAAAIHAAAQTALKN